MTVNVVVAVLIGGLFAGGVYLMLSRNLLRVLLGFMVIGHGANLLLLSSGVGGGAPIVGQDGTHADPIPQALILTSIVITLAVSCFLLAMIYRNYQLTRQSEVPDDPDDVAIEELRTGAGSE
ncbi:NADH-quinone oxidoreductase subunit K [Nakamurella lactea]|uniref:NADH-quinone oxidoreductase subunit K n=1 Tax=Nakamurella lactea TaxID=459515 RepID=UPI0004170AEB|nr:NADH-quinone oxidoreductase subunit K [Nakamurella lactea]